MDGKTEGFGRNNCRILTEDLMDIKDLRELAGKKKGVYEERTKVH